MSSKTLARAGIIAAGLLFGLSAASAESLTLYCSADEAWCQQIKTTFEAENGITEDMTRKSSGET